MNIEKLKASLVGALLMVGFISSPILAAPLEDVSLQFSDSGIVATIKMSGPVRYLRHSPAQQGKTLEIFYDRVADSSTLEWLDDESRQSPPSGLIPSFNVITRDQKVRPKLVIEFSRAAEFTVSQGTDGRSFQVTIKPDKQQRTTSDLVPILPTIKPLTALPPAADQASGDVNKQGFELMSAGRNALAGNDNNTAIEVFNKLLNLPPNAYTADAQEWVGVARERAGQGDRAKAEYELYLKMYPSSEGTERVKIRLASVGDKKSTTLMGAESGDKKKDTQNFTFGGISSRYYRGTTTLDSTYNLNGTTNSASYSATDQSLLITTLDATKRFVNDETDNRFVFRDLQMHNFLETKSVNYTQNTNRVYSAYWESKNRKQDYAYRVGRQMGYGGGVMGRYDGLSGSYGSADSWKTNAVIGQAVDFSYLSQPFFYGISVDRGPVSLYVINQTVDSQLDRRALGTELRYFETGRSAYGQFDYDVNFKELNIAMVNGMWSINDAGTNLIFMLDHRRTPTLSTRNALIGTSVTKVSDLLQTMTDSQVRDLALARTGISNFEQIGFTHPLSKKWQVGADMKLQSITGLPAITDPLLLAQTSIVTLTQPVPGPGSTRTLTGQLIGNGLIREFDIWSFSLNYMTGADTKGQSLFVYNHNVLKEKWTLDLSWLYYKYTQDIIDTTTGVLSGSTFTTRNSPMARISYQFKERLSFDGDVGLEFSNSEGSTQTTTGTRKFMSLGFRWDF